MAKRKTAPVDETAPPAANDYTVLARRYRPQQFSELVGQETVARALVNALESNRVAHAYLFTGVRGVGKTSAARILAKALNCERGPTAKPCDECDICRSIAAGEDIDVLEIDAASNTGVDNIRELRSNANLRPSRSRYKIYIIDEVHMLSRSAFNALLKTLEEPPAHVKFIFATTEVHSIPVTILSRCQRFDFAGIGTGRIVERLKQVVAGERMQADDDALEWIARRAAGSMRDAQSLLDQLLAFTEENQPLTLEQVHRLLGTADDDRVVELASAILEHDPKRALELLDRVAAAGLQLGELLDQLINYWRDLMVVNCAGTVEGKDVSVAAKHRPTMARHAQALSIDSILAGLDILALTKTRLRTSQHARVLLEMALVRLGRLENLVSLSQLAEWLGKGTASRPPSPLGGEGPGVRGKATQTLAPHPNPSPPRGEGAEATATLPLTEQTLPQVWSRVLGQLGMMFAAHLEKASERTLAPPNTLVLRFPAIYNADQAFCAEPARAAKVEEALKKTTGRPWNVRFEAVPSDAPTAAAPVNDTDKTPSRYRRQRAEAEKEPLVKRAIEQLEAQIVHVDEGFGAAPGDGPERPAEADTEET